MTSSFLNNPELSFSLPSDLPFKPSLNAKFPISWKVALTIFAILLMLYWTGNLESKDNKD